MTKVSIGFRGWRFDEDEVFDEHGNYRPLAEMSDDTSARLQRLPTLMDRPCDGCYLAHGADDQDHNVPAAVYGEPKAEVLVCNEHERDFYYWFLELDGDRYEGTDDLQVAFREWFVDGGRAPDDYDGPEHVATAQAETPDPVVPDPEILNIDVPEEEQSSLDLREAMSDVDDDDLDLELDADYPTSDE